jgi:trans-2,3-dihydro-3-hydroxyanthranilate isomerase
VLRLIAPETFNGNTITLAENVGPIPVAFTGDSLHAEMTQRDPEFGAQLDAARVAQLCALTVDDLDLQHPAQVVSTGTSFAVVLLRSPEALARLRVGQDEATAWLRSLGARWFYVLAPEQANGLGAMTGFRARMQFNGGEDPATGSAAGCAISYLVRRGIVASGETILVRQGLEIGRLSELYVSAKLQKSDVTDVRVAGSTVPVAKGSLFLP